MKGEYVNLWTGIIMLGFLGCVYKIVEEIYFCVFVNLIVIAGVKSYCIVAEGGRGEIYDQ